MEVNLAALSLADLKLLLSKAENDLQEALLDGMTWNDSKNLRDHITHLRIIIYKTAPPASETDENNINIS